MKIKEKYINLKKENYLIVFLFAVILLLIGGFSTLALENIASGTEVEPNTELIYYLKVSYDGVDKYGIESEEKVAIDVRSGNIYIEDRIPEGLTFKGFVESGNGSITAVRVADNSGNTIACNGKVVDDSGSNTDTNTYHGLHYNPTTKTVTFTVTDLQAGCYLNVGIRTQTPATIDDSNTTGVEEKRRDFYNYASAREDSLTINSNVEHAFMGDSDEARHKVTYRYTGIIPSTPPELPPETSYVTGALVGVAPNPVLNGYKFSGWTCGLNQIVGNTFTMPNADIECVGSFDRSDENLHKVIYRLDGYKPEGYVLPKEKSYYSGTKVNIDILRKGDIFNGYRFQGWSIESGITITNGELDFTMPNNDVVIVGKFEPATYKVSYKFYNTILPLNYESYLPEEEEYLSGETVRLKAVKGQPSGYKFLGWYMSDNFTMPEENVVIYGEWKEYLGGFIPSITKEIINDKKYYREGDTVKYKITVTNNSNFSISDIVIFEDNPKAKFIVDNNYELRTSHILSIPKIEASSKAEIFAEYNVTADDYGIIKNTVKILGGNSESGYELSQGEDYTATASFIVDSKLTICKEISGISPSNNDFQYKITGNNYETWLRLNNDCNTIYISPGNYTITEIVPQGYILNSVEGAITSNGAVLTVEDTKNYKITFKNQFVKKGFLHSFGFAKNKIKYDRNNK